MSKQPKASRAAAGSHAAVREITLGSNEGVRTVRLRQPSIVWRVRRAIVKPANIEQGLEA